MAGQRAEWPRPRRDGWPLSRPWREALPLHVCATGTPGSLLVPRTSWAASVAAGGPVQRLGSPRVSRATQGGELLRWQTPLVRQRADRFCPKSELKLLHAHPSLGAPLPSPVSPGPCLAVGSASPCAWNVCVSRDAPLVASGSDEDEQVAVTSEAVSMGPGQEAPPLPTPVPRCAGLGGGVIVHSSPLAQEKMDRVTPPEVGSVERDAQG